MKKKSSGKKSDLGKKILWFGAAVIGLATYTFIKTEKSSPKEEYTLKDKANTRLFI